MKTLRSAVATLEAVFIVPAALFMTALFVRNLQPQQYEPAHSAQRVVDWFAARTYLGLWVFLIGLPLVVLAAGCVSLMSSWRSDPGVRAAARECAVAVWRHLAVVVVALATGTSAVILSIVALHLLTD